MSIITAPGVTEFLDLSDAPHSYSGQATKVVKVNAGETAVEFGTGGGGSSTFIGLTDVPATYAGQTLKAVRVNAGETALEFYTAGGGSGITRSVLSIAINTTAGAAALTDYDYNATATLTLTLPTAVGNTNQYSVTRVSGLTTVNTTSSQTINGSTSITLPFNAITYTFVSDGANWNIK